MTNPYHWNPMPHKVAVKCPACGKKAEFEFAEVVQIRLKIEIPKFKANPFFKYTTFMNYGQKWHAAIFYPGLHGGTTSVIRNIPEGYSKADWNHSKYLTRSSPSNLGSIICPNCIYNKAHILKWPKDAFYSVTYKSKILWAFHEESAEELRDYLNEKIRDRRKLRWRGMILKVPTEFQKKASRDILVNTLDKIIQEAKSSIKKRRKK